MAKNSKPAEPESPAPEAAAPEAAKPAAPSLLSSIRSGVVHKPPRIFLYGTHGIGKTTFAASANSPVMICTEEGAEEIEVAKFPRVQDSDTVLKYLRALYKEDHPYETVVIDSADWLEDMVRAEVAAQHTKQELGYGKDVQFMAQRITEILTALNFLREKRAMTSIIVAHSEVKRYDSPMTEPYDRFQPKLQRGVGALFQEWADAVLFATYDVAVKKEEVGFNKEVRRGIGSGERIIYTEERPAFLAKNRYAMPEELPLKFSEVSKHIPYFNGKEK